MIKYSETPPLLTEDLSKNSSNATITTKDKQSKKNTESTKKEFQRCFSFTSNYRLYDDKNYQSKIKFCSKYQQKSNFRSSIKSSTLKQSINQPESQSLSSSKSQPSDYFYNPFKLNQWKYQLKNRKQKPGENIEDYIAIIKELWKRVDPQDRKTELDKIHEFIEGARVLETTLFLNIELSAYLLIPDYLQNINGEMISAKSNMAMFQLIYTTT
ncbi:hypothetical protein RCL_jg20600.t1 [Rhizophagus clarus]|uniref:Uncharacterized protein n=1 Tax=Rhizophagus clarus TaxID=94130 RepID=A0A8H3QMT4_9GLOM|nr:hypothetical protein RCL_jg20600.t1 [Rhizophagus clarus]